MIRSAVLVLVLALVTGCARNAVLDLDLVIPAQATAIDGRSHAYVEIGTSLNDFDHQLFDLDTATDVDVTAIAGGSTRIRYSVVAGDPSTELRVRVRYCREERCNDPDDMRNFPSAEPGLRWSFERAFYAGQRTTAEVFVPALAAGVESDTVETVCRCAVVGCATVAPGASSCEMTTDPCDETAPHFCD